MTDDKLKPGYYLYAFANGQWSLLTSYDPKDRLDALQGALFVEENEKLHTKLVLVENKTPHSKELAEKLVYTSYKSADEEYRLGGGRLYRNLRHRRSGQNAGKTRGGPLRMLLDTEQIDTSATFNRAVGTLSVSLVIATIVTSAANFLFSRFTDISTAPLRLVSIGIFSILFLLLASYLFPWKTIFIKKNPYTKNRKKSLPEKSEQVPPPDEEKITIEQTIANMVDRVVGESTAQKTQHEQALAKTAESMQSLLDITTKCFNNTLSTSSQDKLWMNLFLIGCMNRLKSDLMIPENDATRILNEKLLTIGQTKQDIEIFMNLMPQYTSQSKYLDTIRLGEAVTRMLLDGKGQEAQKTVSVAVEVMFQSRAANKPKQTGAAMTVVMLTSIYDFAGILAAADERKIKKALDVHNFIVRNSLAGFHGTEIRHTGHGIAAAFRKYADATLAAKQITDDFAVRINALDDKNKKNAQNFKLMVKIGVNVGQADVSNMEALESCLGVATRLCDYAGAGQALFAGDINHNSDVDKKVRLIDLGLKSVPGINESLRIFSLY